MYDSKECLSPPVTSRFDHLRMDNPDVVKHAQELRTAITALSDLIHETRDPLILQVDEQPIVATILAERRSIRAARLKRTYTI